MADNTQDNHSETQSNSAGDENSKSEQEQVLSSRGQSVSLNELVGTSEVGMTVKLVLDSPSSGLDKTKTIISIAQGMGVLLAALFVVFTPEMVTKWAVKSPFTEILGIKIKTDKELEIAKKNVAATKGGIEATQETLSKTLAGIETRKEAAEATTEEAKTVTTEVSKELDGIKKEVEDVYGKDSNEAAAITKVVTRIGEELEKTQTNIATVNETIEQAKTELIDSQKTLTETEKVLGTVETTLDAAQEAIQPAKTVQTAPPPSSKK